MKLLRLFALLSCIIIAGGCTRAPSSDSHLVSPDGAEYLAPIHKNERILILVPHPDDETIACAGIIQKALKAGAEVKVVYLTNGDHNQIAFIVYEKRFTFRQGEFIHMGQVRRQEAASAMKLLGLDESRLIFLGYPDFGTFSIFLGFWDEKKPYRSMLTRITHVPYENNLSYGAPYTGESILNDIKRILLDYRPDKIFVSHPSDTNPDHRALYLFLQAALVEVGDTIPKPKVYPYLVHCVGWPLPRHYHPEATLSPPKQYPVGGGMKWFRSDLTTEEVERKHKAILCYKSQTESSAFYLLAFARSNELFGNYPVVTLDLREKDFSASRQWDMPIQPFLKQQAEEGKEEDVFYETAPAADNDTRVSYECDGVDFYIKVTKESGLGRKFATMMYLFGCSHKTPLSQMPKLWILTRGTKIRVFDSRKAVDTTGAGLELTLGQHEFLLKIPLAFLKDPDMILTSLKCYGTKQGVNAMGFRKVIIRRK